jgi:hypothetical protein
MYSLWCFWTKEKCGILKNCFWPVKLKALEFLRYLYPFQSNKLIQLWFVNSAHNSGHFFRTAFWDIKISRIWTRQASFVLFFPWVARTAWSISYISKHQFLSQKDLKQVPLNTVIFVGLKKLQSNWRQKLAKNVVQKIYLNRPTEGFYFFEFCKFCPCIFSLLKCGTSGQYWKEPAQKAKYQYKK